jgi:hypothetical protein
VCPLESQIMLLTDWLKRLSASRSNFCVPSRLPRRQGTRFVDVAEIASQPETLEKRAMLSAANLPLTDIAGDTGFVLNGLGGGNTNFGNPNRAAGDVNGDGFEDMILGSFYENSQAGTAYVLFGKSTGLSPPPDINNLSAADGFRIFGYDGADAGVSVSGGGDINGDGFDDLVVAAANYTRDQQDVNVSIFSSGYVVFGKPTNTDVQLSFIDAITDTAISDSVGFRLTGLKTVEYNTADSVATGGDINGDGFDDVVFGSKQTSFGQGYVGAAFVVFGKESGFSNLDVTDLSGTTGFSFTDSARGGDSATAYIGAAVSIGGDVNGDGFDDLVVGAPSQNLYRNGVREYDGEAYVVFGRSDFSANSEIQVTELDGTNGFVATGLVAEQARTGRSVSSGGDINGDGIDDFVIGAPGDGEGYGSAAGRAYVVFGKTGANFGGTAIVGGDNIARIDLVALSGVNGFVLNGGATNDLAGTSVSITGDINGDGFDDVVVGAPSIGAAAEAPLESDNGTVYVLFGDSNISVPANLGALNGVNGFEIQGVAPYNAGQAVALAGDINGDGFDDLLISEPNNSSGVVFGFFGREFGLNDGNGVNGELGNGVHHIGDETAETVTATQGNSAADILVGGGGNDTLNADGGSDVLIGGSGDDTLTADFTNFAANLRFDGGTGVDILTGDASFSGKTIDLTTVPGNRINDIEVIDLEDAATEILTLDLKTVLAITGAGTTIASPLSALTPFATNDAHTLTILRDADDTINIGDGWTQGSNVTLLDGNSYEVFTQKGATVRIQSAVTLNLDVDENGSFEFQDGILIALAKLNFDSFILDNRGAGSSLSVSAIKTNVTNLGDDPSLDVDENGSFEFQDGILIALSKLNFDSFILDNRGSGSSLTVGAIKTNGSALPDPPAARPQSPTAAPEEAAVLPPPDVPSFQAAPQQDQSEPILSEIPSAPTLPQGSLVLTDQSPAGQESSGDDLADVARNDAQGDFDSDTAFVASQIDVTMDILS